MSFRAEIRSMTFYPTGAAEEDSGLKVFLKLKIPDKSSQEWQSSEFPLRPEEDHGFFTGLDSCGPRNQKLT